MDKIINWSMDLRDIFSHFWGEKARVMVEEKRRSIGFSAIHCFGSSKEKKKIKVWNSHIC